MKTWIFILSFALPLSLYAETIRIWHKPGEQIRHTVCPQGIPYSKCVADALEANPGLATYTAEDIDRSEIPDKDRRSWEWDGTKVKANQAKLNKIENDKQKKIQDRQSARDKLKGLGLTDDEIDAL